jgi:inosose dehydratase
VCAIRLAGGPVSWGVDFADDPDNPPPGAVLDGIAAAGLGWLELGPAGYLPAGALAARGLRAVGTFVFADFHRADAGPALDTATAAALDAIAGAGGRLLVLIDRPSPARAAAAGRPQAAPRLDDAAWRGMRERLRRAAAQAATRGIRAVVHPHAGGYMEYADEIDRLLDELGADELGLCLDTGHALYAGTDPAALVRRHAARLEHLHIKDLSAPAGAHELGFWDAVAAGAFCPVGEGMLALDELRAALADAAYDGFATVEQDRRADTPGDPAADLRRSVERLRAAGIG